MSRAASRASVRASHANGARRRSGARESVWGSPSGASPSGKTMSRVLYFDCFSGIAGDMVLGALLDAGLPLADLKQALGSLAISDYEVTAERVLRAGVSATRFRVHEAGNDHDANQQ